MAIGLGLMLGLLLPKTSILPIGLSLLRNSGANGTFPSPVGCETISIFHLVETVEIGREHISI